MENRIFISHASEDKDEIARPLSNALSEHGFDIWFDENSLALGDNLRKSIDNGISNCEFGVVILSESYFMKEWPKLELEGLISKEVEMGKTILPIWHKIGKERVFEYSPILSNKVGVNSEKGIEFIVNQIVNAIIRKKEHSNIKSKLDKSNSPFKIICFDIEGEKIKNEVLKNWKSENNLDTKSIEKVELFVYHDFSGINLSYPSGIYLKNEFVIKITEIDIIHAINKLKYRNLHDYEFLLLQPEPKNYDIYVSTEDWTDVPIEKCFLSIMAIKTNTVASSADDAYRLILEIADYFDNFNIGRLSEFSYDSLFDQGTYAFKLFKILLNDNKFDYIDKLIFENLARDRFSWVIAQLLIRNLKFGLSQESKALINKLIDAPEPLQNRWKKDLKKLIKLYSKP